MRGRKPAPTALVMLEGGKKARTAAERRRATEPKPRRTDLDPPEGLRPFAEEEWNRVAAELDKLGLFTVLDRTALAAYCEMWQTFVDARELVQEHGYISVGDRGIVKHPAVQIMRDAAVTLRGYCTEFGFTPSARGRMALPAGEDDDAQARRLLS